MRVRAANTPLRSHAQPPSAAMKPAAHSQLCSPGVVLLQVPRPSPQGFPVQPSTAAQLRPSPTKPFLHVHTTSPALLLGSSHSASGEHTLCPLHSSFCGAQRPRPLSTKPSAQL